MTPRQPLPRIWLMTDERADAELEHALMRLPRGGGVVFRHYHTPAPLRRRRFAQVRAIARRRGLMLVLAGSPRTARAWGADGIHGRASQGGRRLLHTAPAHNHRELAEARRAGCDLIFLSPVFPTRSHPNGSVLGPLRFAGLARSSPMPVIALGGMTAARFRRLALLGAYGWAAIDAWRRDDS